MKRKIARLTQFVAVALVVMSIIFSLTQLRVSASSCSPIPCTDDGECGGCRCDTFKGICGPVITGG